MTSDDDKRVDELPTPGLKPLSEEREKAERKRSGHFYGIGYIIFGLALFFVLLAV